jgi:hypothetical protein
LQLDSLQVQAVVPEESLAWVARVLDRADYAPLMVADSAVVVADLALAGAVVGAVLVLFALSGVLDRLDYSLQQTQEHSLT